MGGSTGITEEAVASFLRGKGFLDDAGTTEDALYAFWFKLFYDKYSIAWSPFRETEAGGNYLTALAYRSANAVMEGPANDHGGLLDPPSAVCFGAAYAAAEHGPAIPCLQSSLDDPYSLGELFVQVSHETPVHSALGSDSFLLSAFYQPGNSFEPGIIATHIFYCQALALPDGWSLMGRQEDLVTAIERGDYPYVPAACHSIATTMLFIQVHYLVPESTSMEAISLPLILVDQKDPNDVMTIGHLVSYMADASADFQGGIQEDHGEAVAHLALFDLESAVARCLATPRR